MTDSFSLERLRELHEAATPEPWHADAYHAYIWGPNGAMVADDGDHTGPGSVLRARGVGGKLPIVQNMDLIVYLRSHVPAILALADRLQEADAVIADGRTSAAGTTEMANASDYWRWFREAVERHAWRPRDKREPEA